MPLTILAEGNGRSVVYWAQTQEELGGMFCNCPEIKLVEINKLAKIISYFTELGSFPPNWKKFHKLQNEQYLFEIKSHQIRLIGFFHQSAFVVVLCVRKKKDNHKDSDLDKANRLMALALKELGDAI